MNQLKSVLISILIILALAGIYFGAYRPFVKAQLYVATRGVSQTFQTLDEFASFYDRIFDYYSPIGNREVAKFFIENTLGIIAQKEQSEEVSRMLVEYGEFHIYENEVVHLLQVAYGYDTLWQRFRDKEYFEKAESYYNRVHEIGPRLPHALYGLFNLYERSGDSEKQREISKEILRYWPGDERVEGIIGV